HLGALAVTEPADARRQALKLHALARKTKPTMQGRIIGEEFEREVVCAAYVVRIARQCDKTKRPLASAKKRANVFGHEAGNLEGVVATGIKRLLAYVVAVIERDRAVAFQGEHCFDVPRH